MKNIALLNLLLIVFFLDPCLYANPFNGIVADGGVSISPSGSLLTISQSSSTAVINWNTFNIANGESTVFEFNGAAGANSAVLNLVSAGNGGSTIAGSLSSTVGHLGPIGGTVLLLNPDGILFTPTAQISVGSLVASTLGLPDQNDFLNRTTLHFNGTSTAGIATQNGASLNALGDVFLIAHTVQNSGIISAGNEAGLAAGNTVTLAQSGSERLTVVAGTGTGTPFGVDNTESGKINAVVTELKAAGGNIYALAINNGGLVRATSLVKENGRIFFRATDSTGNQGAVSSTGTINVDGDNVNAADVTVQGSQATLDGTVNAGAGSLTVTTTSANGVNGTGDIDINNNTGIAAGSVSLHSGTDGAGDISFGGGVKIQADSHFYQAGIGDGSAATASADLTDNNPTFLNQSGNGSPASFTFEQDATIVDADIPASSQFSLNTPPANYIIQSDGGNLTLDTGANVAGSALTLNAAGTLTIGGNLNLNSLSASGNTIELNGTGGSETVTTTGKQTYNDNVTLGAATTLGSSGGADITFAKTVNGAQSLAVNTAGTTTFGGAVGNNQALASLTTDAAGTTALNGGTVNATAVDFKDDVTLGANTTINELSADGTTTTFEKTVNADSAANNRTLTVQFLTAGGTTFGGAVGNNQALASLTTYSPGGTIAINGGTVTTSGAQSYFGGVTLGANTTLKGTTLDLFGAVNGGGNNLTLNNSGLATLGAALSGVNALAASGGGSLSVLNTISAATVNDSEATAFNSGGMVTTTGTQTYNGAVTLGVGTTLSSSGAGANGDISFLQTVNGAQALAVNTAGTTTFGGAVGNNQALTSLTTDAVGTTALNGGTVNATTTDFKDDVTLGANTTLNGTTATFEKTVNADLAANNRTLTVNDSGLTTFGGAVGNSQTLASVTTDAAGTTAINGGSVTTSGAQTYHDDVTLDAAGNATTLTGSAATFDKTVRSTTDGEDALTVNAGTTTFGGAVGGNNQRLASLATDASGTTALNGGSVTTTGGQTYNDDVTLGAATTLGSSGGADITFAKTVNGTQTLAANTAGTTTFGGAVGNNQGLTSLTTDAAGTTALNGGTLTVLAADFKDDVTLGGNTIINSPSSYLFGTTTFEKTVNADLAANNRTLTIGSPGILVTTTFGGAVGNNQALAGLTTFSLGGATAINGGTVTTVGAQSYNDNVTLGANTTLNGTTLNLSGALTGGGNNLTLNNSGAATLDGALSGVNALTANGSGNLVVNNTISAASVKDSEATTLFGGTVTTSGSQTYNGALTLGADTTLTSSGGADIAFGQTVDGAQSLAVNTSGDEIFNGAVGGNNALTSLTTDGSGTLGGSAQFNGGAVTTTGGQTYNDNVTLGANTTLNGTTLNLSGALTGGGNSLTLNNSGAATLGGTLSGVNTLTASGGGNLSANSIISVSSVNDSEATALNGGTVTTSGAQTYNQNVTLGAATTLASSGGADITFAKTVDGAQSLAVNTSGNEIFNGAVGGNTALKSLTTDGSGTGGGSALLNGGSVTTTGGQTYNDNATLGANTTLNGTTLNLFGAVTGGGNNLTLNNSGAATLGGALSGVNTLIARGGGNLVVNNTISASSINDSETTGLNGGLVTTVGAQTYNGAVTLGVVTTLSSSGGADITFAKTVDGAQTLAVNTSGNEIFNGAVGGNTALTSVTTDGSGTVGGSALLNAGSVTTIGSQTYNDNITLGANTTLNGTTLNLFGALTGGGNNLTLNNSGAATLGGALSGVNALTASGGGNLVVNKIILVESVNDNEATALNGGLVTTTGTQTYNQNMMLGANTTLTSSGGGNIAFAKAVDGAQSLAVNTSGNEIFNGAVGGSTALTSVTTDGSGTVGGSALLNGGSVTTIGSQTYNDNIALGANTTLNGTTLSLLDALTGGGNNLTLNNSGTATLDGPLSGVNALNFIGSGNLVANGSISAGSLYDTEPTALNGRLVATTGTQTYGNIVTLGANTTLILSGLIFTGIGAISGNGHPLVVNGVVYSVVGEDETLKRSLLGAILPTYHPIEVRARKPWQHKRSGIPPWSITDPMNSLQVPFD